MGPHTKLLVAEERHRGLRADQLLAGVEGISRRYAAQLMAQGRVTLRAKSVKKGDPVVVGGEYSVNLQPFTQTTPAGPPSLVVVLERDELVVVNKPAGTPTAALSSDLSGTLAGALLGRYPEMSGVGYGEREPGLLHRLDNGTSGLVVAARSQESFAILKQALARGHFEKGYLAIVQDRGLPEQGVIDEPVAPHPKNRRKMWVCKVSSRGARAAQSRYQVVERSEGLALVEVSVPAARRHQVRLHLAHLGCPIIGDRLYGGEPHQCLGVGRHALHAHRVALAAASGIALRVTIPLASDMRSLLAASRFSGSES